MPPLIISISFSLLKSLRVLINDSVAVPATVATIAAVALAGLPIELLLVAIPGRSYGYYYTAWLPMIGVLCALFARNMLKRGAGDKRSAPARIALLCAFLPMIVGVPSAAVLARVSTTTSTALTRAEAV